MTNSEYTAAASNVHNVLIPKSERIETFSPVKVAKSIGVSESSLKRWCDAGHLNAVKTAGGHRRVTLSEVVRFVKQRGMMFSRPEMIGLPSLEHISVGSVEDGVEQLRQSLLAADDVACQKLLTFLYLEGRGIPEIVDLFLTPAFASIGDDWSQGNVEVYEERRAGQTCSLAIKAIKT
ncbi:MAG: excisionase family DNA binding protein, partial [Mariniblastus sp.]